MSSGELKDESATISQFGRGSKESKLLQLRLREDDIHKKRSHVLKVVPKNVNIILLCKGLLKKAMVANPGRSNQQMCEAISLK